MPNPSDYDNREDWMSACIPAMMDEGYDQDRAVAACSNIWDNKSNIDESIEDAVESYLDDPLSVVDVEIET